MDARIAPNFPNREKKIMNKAEIFMTRRLPTLVMASRPEFSTEAAVPVNVPHIPFSMIDMPCQPIPRAKTEGGTNVAPAYLDTAIRVPVDSISDANEAASMAKQSCAQKIGYPHWNG